MQPELQAPGMDLQQSEEYDQVQLQNFLNPRKSKSDDLFIGNLIIKKSQMQMRPSLIFNPPKPTENGKQAQGPSVFRRRPPKPKKAKLCDYRKNICGYITKKIIRQFVGPTFQEMVQLLCEKHHSTYNDCRSYYLSQIQHITGPTHVANLLIPLNNKQKKMKAIFREFFDWFLKERYVRYLLLQGKMADKQAYIEYKNLFLLPLLSTNQQQVQVIIKEEEEQIQQLKVALKRKSRSKSASNSKSKSQ